MTKWEVEIMTSGKGESGKTQLKIKEKLDEGWNLYGYTKTNEVYSILFIRKKPARALQVL